MNSDAMFQRRYLALWFPFLTTDRLQRQHISTNGAEQDNRPLVVTKKVKGALRITNVDPRALKLGLTPGLTLADARARICNLEVSESDPQADQHFLTHLADICDRFTPSIAFDFSDGLILDITGCAQLFDGEVHLRRRIVSRFHRTGLNVRASVAITPDAARALARFSKVEIAPPGQDEVLIKKLPVRALAALERETIIALARAGLKKIGDLSERPPQVLAARFGQGLVTCLMRTLGREDARITPLRPVPSIVVERHFPEPFTQMEVLENVLTFLLEEAQNILLSRDEGGRAFEANFFRSDGVVRRLEVRTGRPSRDVKAILKLYQERFATLSDPFDPGFGFDAIRLSVPLVETLSAAQTHLDNKHGDNLARNNAAISDLIDQLSVRFGQDRVVRFEARDTHDPDCDVQRVPASNKAVTEQQASQQLCWRRIEAGEPPLRPLQLFANPQPIEALAEVPDGPPMRFRWRRVLHDVARAEGPERIEPEWWRKNNGAPARDYYRVEDAHGCRFWIFRQGHYAESDTQPRWFVHGLFA